MIDTWQGGVGPVAMPKKHHGIECPFCKDQVFSMYRHDCRSCACGYCYADGGRDYLRGGWGSSERGHDLQPRTIFQDWDLLFFLWLATRGY